MAKDKSKRFIVKEKQSGFALTNYVLMDRTTGVNYLYTAAGYSGGLTVLVDGMGNPIVTPVPQED